MPHPLPYLFGGPEPEVTRSFAKPLFKFIIGEFLHHLYWSAAFRLLLFFI